MEKHENFLDPLFLSVLRIRIRRILMFLGLLDPDPIERVRKNPTVFPLLFDFSSLKYDVNVA
jgi:hypothetical protein